MATETVIVEGAPGRRTFLATPVPGLDTVPAVDSRGPLTVVLYDDGTPHGHPVIVPARCVRPLSANEQARIRGTRIYRHEWSVKTGRPEREIYVPAAIRPLTTPEEAW